MLAVVRLDQDFLENPASAVELADLAAEHELILVYADEAPACFVHSLKLVLRRYRLVLLMTGKSLLRHEIDLVRHIVEEGGIPVLLAVREPLVTDFTRCLGVDVDVTLPRRRSIQTGAA